MKRVRVDGLKMASKLQWVLEATLWNLFRIDIFRTEGSGVLEGKLRDAETAAILVCFRGKLGSFEFLNFEYSVKRLVKP